MDQSVILVLIGLGSITTILLLYYGLRISSYCCLEEKLTIRAIYQHIVKPPRWSQSLASKIEYIDDTALEIVRERIRRLEESVVSRLDALVLILRDESLFTNLIIRIKFILNASRKLGLLGAIKILLSLMRLKRLYKKVSKIANIGKRKHEYYRIIGEILEYLDNIAGKLEALDNESA